MALWEDIQVQGRVVEEHRPWPRVVVSSEGWEAAVAQLTAGECFLLGLWGAPDGVHMALGGHGGPIGVVSIACPEGQYPSVGRYHSPALRLERALRDLYGLEPVGLPDTRPWLDHGQWGTRHPFNSVPSSAPNLGPYPFLPVEGEGLHQIPVGPVHAGIIEPGHFRFTANGETVVRLEERLGYVHKGIEGLMTGADIAHGAALAERVSGDSTVAYAFGFAQAVEAALDLAVPARALWLRALMAELERLANHFGDIGAICNDAAFALMHAHCAVLRERVLRTAAACFGHRLMRGCIVPGGVSEDARPEGISALKKLVDDIHRQWPRLVNLYDQTPSLQDRTVGTGRLTRDLAARYAAGGYIGRASGRHFDARSDPGYAPYPQLRFDVPLHDAGDVNARVWIRIHEVEQSLALVAQILASLPTGALRTTITHQNGLREGMALVEGFRGDILVWLRIAEGGAIARCHLRDPSWFQWPLLEAVIEGNIVADFPLCNKSFNCSYSGHDL